MKHCERVSFSGDRTKTVCARQVAVLGELLSVTRQWCKRGFGAAPPNEGSPVQGNEQFVVQIEIPFQLLRACCRHCIRWALGGGLGADGNFASALAGVTARVRVNSRRVKRGQPQRTTELSRHPGCAAKLEVQQWPSRGCFSRDDGVCAAGVTGAVCRGLLPHHRSTQRRSAAS